MVRQAFQVLCFASCACAIACGGEGRASTRESTSLAQQALTSGTEFGSLIRLDGENSWDRFGEYMAGVGDVNGDGFDDLAVGSAYWAPPEDTSAFGEYGRVYIFFGSATGVNKSRYQTLSGSATEERLADVRRAGDVNGDGYTDVLIQGALNYKETGLYLHLGGPNGLDPNPAWHIPFEPLHPRAYGNVGDLNGDGLSEVLVAVYEYLTQTEYRLQIYGGTEQGLTAEPIWIYRSNDVMRYTESGVGVGDFNGDGYNDVIVGRSWCGTVAPDVNLAGFWGSAAGLATSPDWGVTDTDCSFIGKEVENVGDLDGDGYADLVTSSQSYAAIGFAGYAKAYRGGARPATTAAWAKSFPENNSGWIDAAGIGDVRGDGFNDLLIGLDYFFDPPNGKEQYFDGYPPIGVARVYSGSNSGLSSSESWWAYDEAFNDNNFAGTTAGAGDLNGDGFPDIALADYLIGVDYDRRKTGFVYVYYGGSGAEPNGRVLWDLSASEVGEVSKLPNGTRLKSSTAFDIGCIGLGTQGRTRVKLEAEIKPIGTAFDGTALRQSDGWVDTGTGGTHIVLPVTGLTSNTTYKFRARLVYRPDTPTLTRHTRWFAGSAVTTACDGTEPDLDRDGICDDVDVDDDGDGVADTADCAPRDQSIYPGATEQPNDGIDQDCSGADTVTCFVDSDGDGFGGANPELGEGTCTTKGLSHRSDDCNDSDPTVFPNAPEIANDQLDQNCDGLDSVLCYVDKDGDGFGSAPQLTPLGQCPSTGLTTMGGDCNDDSKDVYPGAPETVDDGTDQDCSGSDSVTCFVDDDGDGFGFGDALSREGTCGVGGLAHQAGDCNDSNALVFPGARDLPGDGIDSDCDGFDPPVSAAGGSGALLDSGLPDAGIATASGGSGNALGTGGSGSASFTGGSGNALGIGSSGNALSTGGSGNALGTGGSGNPLANGGSTSRSTSPATDATLSDAFQQDVSNQEGGCGCRTTHPVRRQPQLVLVAFALALLRRRYREGLRARN